MFTHLMKIMCLLLALCISRLDATAAVVYKTSLNRKIMTYKVMSSRISVMSGQIYKIVHPDIAKGEHLTVKFEGDGFQREVAVKSDENGFVRFSIPFVLDNNFKLKNLNAKVTLLEKGLIFNDIKIRKPILNGQGKDVFISLIDVYLAKANLVLNEANVRGDVAAINSLEKSIAILGDVKAEYISKGTITYSDVNGTRIIEKQDIATIKEMIAGSLMGIIDEGKPEAQTPVIRVSDLNAFFDNFNNFSVDSIHLAFKSFNSTNDNDLPPVFVQG